MMARTWLKGFLILFALLFLSAGAFQVDAWARAGGGGSMGSRGSRSASPPKPYTAPSPTRPSPTPGVTPSRPVTPPRVPAQQLLAEFRRRYAGRHGRRPAFP